MAVHQLLISRRPIYDSLKREVLCSILIQFGIPVKLVRLIKVCLNEIFIEVHVGKNLLD
jgi:hypothetical protein